MKQGNGSVCLVAASHFMSELQISPTLLDGGRMYVCWRIGRDETHLGTSHIEIGEYCTPVSILFSLRYSSAYKPAEQGWVWLSCWSVSLAFRKPW